ncbi:hypothetical protein T4D_5274 [Trichinella pseudospiralis]|uniref:Uncharacterized protein n=1 Tax=Trichinella pseudospiralis TaxID=6337 RepID=A0A0V1FH21_TRIPS|nr:hypothetical protein T4D_5274 [Trichinella pseudospiralis]
MISIGALVCLIYVASGSIVQRSLNMDNEEKMKGKRGRHEADRGRHEAELWNEDIRYMRFPRVPIL